MKELTFFQTSNLKKVIKKFPQFGDLAGKLSHAGINWGLAAGSAYFVYLGGQPESIDDVDIWIARKDKAKIAPFLGKNWVKRSSERHQAENIELDIFDIFTCCRKFKEGKQLLDYHWTVLVEQNLRKVVLGGLEYHVITPEDIALLKIPYPRGEREWHEVKKLVAMGLDKEYLEKRLKECQAEKEVRDNLSQVGLK